MAYCGFLLIDLAGGSALECSSYDCRLTFAITLSFEVVAVVIFHASGPVLCDLAASSPSGDGLYSVAWADSFECVDSNRTVMTSVGSFNLPLLKIAASVHVDMTVAFYMIETIKRSVDSSAVAIDSAVASATGDG